MPRLGLGSLELSSLGGTGQDVVTTIDDFFFESNASGEINPMLTTSRTSLITYSEDFSAYTVSGNLTFGNNVTSPIGTTNASTINLTSGSSFIYENVNVTQSTVYTFSFHVKKGTLNDINFKLAIYDDSNNSFISVDIPYSTSTDWTRVEHTFTTPSGCTDIRAYIFRNTSSQEGDFYVWGTQVEQDSFVSAYIPTSGSTVTVSTTLNDTSEVWDFDGTDIMLEADPEDEGFWEEGSNLVLNHNYEELGLSLIHI